MKVAQLKTTMGATAIIEEGMSKMMENSGWVRLTEFAEIEFTPLPPTEVVDKQLKQLDEAEAELRNKFQEKLNELANERAKLLSIGHEAAS